MCGRISVEPARDICEAPGSSKFTGKEQGVRKHGDQTIQPSPCPSELADLGDSDRYLACLHSLNSNNSSLSSSAGGSPVDAVSRTPETLVTSASSTTLPVHPPIEQPRQDNGELYMAMGSHSVPTGFYISSCTMRMCKSICECGIEGIVFIGAISSGTLVMPFALLM